MTHIGAVHLVFALLAIVLGAVVLLQPKGTRWHRTWGHGYVWCMLGLVATSLAMYELTGSVTPFHLGGLVAGATIVVGMGTVLRRRPPRRWIEAHAAWMAWSYVGLMAAFVAETSTRFAMPLLDGVLERHTLWPAFWSVVVLGSLGAIALGAWLIRTRLPAAVRSVRGGAQEEQDVVGAATVRDRPPKEPA